MKKFMLVLAATIFAFSLSAQEAKPVQRTVSASGTAEIEVIPDEIYVQVVLKEYKLKNGSKVDIDKIKNNFLAACKAMGLTEKDIAVQGYSGYDNSDWWQRKKKENPDLLASVTYQIKVDKVEKLDELVSRMDDQATQNFYISRTEYSKIDQVRDSLKVAALKTARSKAALLAEALNEELGEVLTINDPIEIGQHPIPVYKYARMSVAADAVEAAPLDVDFKKIKIGYQANLTYSLK